MDRIDLRRRALLNKQKLASQKNAHLLPEYPVVITPHMSDHVSKERKKTIYKKIVFEK